MAADRDGNIAHGFLVERASAHLSITIARQKRVILGKRKRGICERPVQGRRDNPALRVCHNICA
jgi:hypothetical protein